MGTTITGIILDIDAEALTEMKSALYSAHSHAQQRASAATDKANRHDQDAEWYDGKGEKAKARYERDCATRARHQAERNHQQAQAIGRAIDAIHANG